MQYKLSLISSAVLLISSNLSHANNDYELLESSHKSGTWGWAYDYLIEKGTKYADKKRAIPDQNAIKLVGDEFEMNHIANIAMGACGTDRRSKWEAPWLDSKYKTGTTNINSMFYREEFSKVVSSYTFAANTPVEIQSKNFRSAGAKQFAKFKYSWLVDNGRSYTIINNEGNHDSNFTHVFDGLGKHLLNGAIFSDYDIGFKIGVSFSGNGEGYTYNGLKFRPLWGRDMGLYGCGTTEVNIERNTRPVINSVSFLPWGGTHGTFVSINLDAEDKHTNEADLKVDWTIYYDGRVLPINAGRLMHPGYVPVNKRHTYRYKVVVSDGNLSTTKEGVIK